MLRAISATFLTLLLSVCASRAQEPDPGDWTALLAQAKGETVYFHAWGGEPRINAYIGWVGDEVAKRYGITLKQVKVDDTANVVSRVLAEKAAGQTTKGSVDLVWINGENFAAMKARGLLLKDGWADKLPNWKYVDVAGKPTVTKDFTVPTDGLEAPWGMAQLVFMYDTARTSKPPRSMAALLDWARDHPGRFTYPQPPDFHGSTFLKQALYELAPDPARLLSPASDEDFETVTGPLFAYLDKLHPLMWRSGRAFPQNSSAMRQRLADNETDIAFTFNPAGASNAIANGELPDTVRTYVLDGGTIGNTHFVAIPFNATAPAGAMVVADFLMSPEAQARKQDPDVWGDPTVLDVDRLPAADKARFDELDLGIATLDPQDLGETLPEPHPSWIPKLEQAWATRYGIE
ncbi:putative thiamine transport system substrate-binding protein [Breoghania corrubedonensis]|uniref:Putative thiamine transport system substrate-binding protein n=1 Tax=Breoghania corrubedonensis TaxID=665038 RepID=A0A2T5VFJ3_9HYPH|nr:ABC transporter substrate-binding protein [Breoghania corrubedonensis]PTW62520.1 putative thiamine transport system substrate-binding protein [Breoghania corrubedonensis]